MPLVGKGGEQKDSRERNGNRNEAAAAAERREIVVDIREGVEVGGG